MSVSACRQLPFRLLEHPEEFEFAPFHGLLHRRQYIFVQQTEGRLGTSIYCQDRHPRTLLLSR